MSFNGVRIDPDPMPEWRRLVEREVGYYALPVQARGAAYRKAPLPDVLHLLSVIAEIGGDCRTPLARIVAVCETQVGDGWQADPDQWTKPKGSGSVWGLLTDFSYDSPVGPNETGWRCLGKSAARWLRDLTEEQS